MGQRLHHKVWVLVLAAAVLATLLAEGLYRSGGATRFEHFYSDVWHRVAAQRFEPQHTALVILDDPTLNQYPDEPLMFWTRHFATAIDTLNQVGAKLIVIDYIFSGSPERWFAKLGMHTGAASRNYDQAFRAGINRGNVLLAGFRVRDGASINDFVLPSPDYLLALPNFDLRAHVGLANLRLDADSTVRRFGMAEANSAIVEKEDLPSLAFGPLAAIRASGQDVRSNTWQFGEKTLDATSELNIRFAGPPKRYHRVSFGKLLAPNAVQDADVKALAGKVVVIGAGYAGGNDVHPTPYSTSIGGANEMMSGPEIQAHIIETLLSGRMLEESTAPLRIMGFLLCFSLLAFAGVRLRPAQSFVLTLGVIAVSTAAAYQTFLGDQLFPIGHLHIGIALVVLFVLLIRMTREERERARVGAMFGRYVSPQVVSALLASPELPELGGTSCEITVLFSDIRNFTTLSEKLAAHEVVELLNTYFERACGVLLAEGATIDKFIGDAIMAEFGAPLPQADHARRALRAALALRTVAVDFRAWVSTRFAGRDLPEFDIGIGLHSGEAIIGNIGSSARMEYTAIGDTVNIASRLEGLTKETGCAILASGSSIVMAGAGVSTGSEHSLQVKGRVQPVEACELLAVQPTPE